MVFYLDFSSYTEEQLDELINNCFSKIEKLQKNETNRETYENLIAMYEKLIELKNIKFSEKLSTEEDLMKENLYEKNDEKKEEDEEETYDQSNIVIETDPQLKKLDKLMEKEKRLLVEKFKKRGN